MLSHKQEIITILKIRITTSMSIRNEPHEVWLAIDPNTTCIKCCWCTCIACFAQTCMPYIQLNLHQICGTLTHHVPKCHVVGTSLPQKLFSHHVLGI